MTTMSEMVEWALRNGYKVVNPNGLPLRCVTGTGLLLECEHGDHPDYKFPVHLEYTGTLREGHYSDARMYLGRAEDEPVTDEEARYFAGEGYHAVIYCDGYVIVTIYECNYAIFSYRDGKSLGGRYCEPGMSLTKESLEEVHRRFPR